MSPHRRNAQTRSSGRWTQIVTVNLPVDLIQAEEKSCNLRGWEQSPRCCYSGLAVPVLATRCCQTLCLWPKQQHWYTKAKLSLKHLCSCLVHSGYWWHKFKKRNSWKCVCVFQVNCPLRNLSKEPRATPPSSGCFSAIPAVLASRKLDIPDISHHRLTSFNQFNRKRKKIPTRLRRSASDCSGCRGKYSI